MIRSAQPQDIEHLVGLLRELFSIEEDFLFSAHKQRRGLELLLKSERARVLVVEDKGQVIGMATGQLIISTAEGGVAMIVEDVAIATPFRSLGYGPRLLDELARWAMERGARRMQLLADRNNRPARAFYEKVGWTTTQLICLRKYNHN